MNKTFKSAIIVGILSCLTASMAAGKELPSCDSVGTTFRRVVNASPNQNIRVKNLNSSTDKRWCLASSVAVPYPGLGGSFMDFTFTIEWMNEVNNEYWVEIKERKQVAPSWMTDSDNILGSVLIQFYKIVCNKKIHSQVDSFTTIIINTNLKEASDFMTKFSAAAQEKGIPTICSELESNKDFQEKIPTMVDPRLGVRSIY